MAQRTIVQLVSDLTGDEIPDGKGQTVNWSYRGVDYTTDLTAKEAAGFDKAVAMYIEHSTKLGGRRRTGGKRDKSETQAIKAWADEQGMEYPQRGRLPQSLIDAYNAR